MIETNFGVRLDHARTRKLERHLELVRLTKRAFMELTIDGLPVYSQATNGKRKK